MSYNPTSDVRSCENCGKILSKEFVWHKGYQGQDYQTHEWEKHGIEDCIKYLRFLLDKRNKQ